MGYSPVGYEIKDQKSSSSGHILEPKILITIGKAAINNNDYVTAVECYEKVLELQPNDPEAAFLLKRAKFMIDDDNEDSSVEQRITPNSDIGAALFEAG